MPGQAGAMTKRFATKIRWLDVSQAMADAGAQEILTRDPSISAQEAIDIASKVYSEMEGMRRREILRK